MTERIPSSSSAASAVSGEEQPGPLSTQGAGGALTDSGAPTVTVPPIETAPARKETEWKPEDHIRRSIVIGLMVALGLVGLFGMAGSIWGPWPNVRECLQIIVPVLSTLLASAIGFYFGAGGSAGKS